MRVKGRDVKIEDRPGLLGRKENEGHIRMVLKIMDRSLVRKRRTRHARALTNGKRLPRTGDSAGHMEQSTGRTPIQGRTELR